LFLQEPELEADMDDLADDMGVLLQKLAPDAFDNLTAFSDQVKIHQDDLIKSKITIFFPLKKP
jgi:hypothetical protein